MDILTARAKITRYTRAYAVSTRDDMKVSIRVHSQQIASELATTTCDLCTYCGFRHILTSAVTQMGTESGTTGHNNENETISMHDKTGIQPVPNDIFVNHAGPGPIGCPERGQSVYTTRTQQNELSTKCVNLYTTSTHHKITSHYAQ